MKQNQYKRQHQSPNIQQKDNRKEETKQTRVNASQESIDDDFFFDDQKPQEVLVGYYQTLHQSNTSSQFARLMPQQPDLTKKVNQNMASSGGILGMGEFASLVDSQHKIDLKQSKPKSQNSQVKEIEPVESRFLPPQLYATQQKQKKKLEKQEKKAKKQESRLQSAMSSGINALDIELIESLLETSEKGKKK